MGKVSFVASFSGKSLNRERTKCAAQLTEWRINVFKRDNYTCQHCNFNNDLHAHHIKSFADYPDNRYDINNGLTLCVECHGKVHGKNFKPNKQKFSPICELCECSTSGRSRYCRSCAISLWHSTQGHFSKAANQLEIQNHQILLPGFD